MTDWRSKQVLIIGAARQGLAIARYLSSKGAKITLTDCRSTEELKKEQAELSDLDVVWALGGHPIELLQSCDLVCPSGGVALTLPLITEAVARGIPLSNDSQIFLDAAPCPVVGITGSAGKTTTTTLLGRIAQEALGVDCSWVGGNIGNPLISDVEKMKPDHLAIVELSSFQLEIMTKAPQVAAVLNLTPNHLDRHITMEAYSKAKARILRYQKAGDMAVLNREDPGSWSLRDLVKGNLITFGRNKPGNDHPGVFLQKDSIKFWDGVSTKTLLPRNLIALRGEHNFDNVLAACALAVAADLPESAMMSAVEGFGGVEHRLEFVRQWGGAAWYNDSIATAPERAIAAMRSFDQPLILLAGGRDKDLPWSEFASWTHRRVDHLILFGEAQEVIRNAVGPVHPGKRPFTIHDCSNLLEALKVASEIVEPGDVVLLSPGGTSFDEFHDFSERGAFFRKWVKNLS